MTLGQPAADVLTGVLCVDRVVLRRDADYGRERSLKTGRRKVAWIPLKHPGQRTPAWAEHHRRWADSRAR